MLALVSETQACPFTSVPTQLPVCEMGKPSHPEDLTMSPGRTSSAPVGACCRRKSSFCPSFHQATTGLGQPLGPHRAVRLGCEPLGSGLEAGAMAGGSGEKAVIRRQGGT